MREMLFRGKREVLEAHKKWLNGDKDGAKANLSGADLNGADLSEADLSEADLSEANLNGADLDYSCWPLWCGWLNVHIDDRQAIQMLYHLTRNVLFSKNTSKELKRIFSMKSVLKLVNKFHWVEECGIIEGNAEE